VGVVLFQQVAGIDAKGLGDALEGLDRDGGALATFNVLPVLATSQPRLVCGSGLGQAALCAEKFDFLIIRRFSFGEGSFPP
jgi:hypothetical protein